MGENISTDPEEIDTESELSSRERPEPEKSGVMADLANYLRQTPAGMGLFWVEAGVTPGYLTNPENDGTLGGQVGLLASQKTTIGQVIGSIAGSANEPNVFNNNKTLDEVKKQVLATGDQKLISSFAATERAVLAETLQAAAAVTIKEGKEDQSIYLAPAEPEPRK